MAQCLVAILRGVGYRQRLRLERRVVELQIPDGTAEPASQAERTQCWLGQQELVVLHLPAAIEVEGVAPPVGGVVELHVVPLALLDPRLAPHDQLAGHDFGGSGRQRQFKVPLCIGTAIEQTQRGGCTAGGHTVEADPEGARDLAQVDPLAPLAERGLVGGHLGLRRAVEDQRAPVQTRPGARLEHQAATGPVGDALLRMHPKVKVKPWHRLGGRALCRERGQRAHAHQLQ